MSRNPQPVESSHTPLPWDVVEATENHGPYITTRFGTTVCDLYAMTDPHSAHSIINGINKPKPISFTDAEQNAVLIAKAVSSYADMFAALLNVRKLISEAALTGFNYLDGDWPERLFASQAVTSAALDKASITAGERPMNRESRTKKEWMKLYGTPDAPPPSETGWTGFSHPTRKQWAELWAKRAALSAARQPEGGGA